MNRLLGYYKVGNLEFSSKIQACIHSTATKMPVEWVFNDNVFNSYDWTVEPKEDILELYRRRAQQLRDKYDYLILYFSGGSDSYNVLRSYIDNGIKLDEICVKWCTRVIDSGIYTPNTIDTTAYNYLSEWDYAIKPVLDEIKISNPEIKITIVNWLDDRLENDPAHTSESIHKQFQKD